MKYKCTFQKYYRVIFKLWRIFSSCPKILKTNILNYSPRYDILYGKFGNYYERGHVLAMSHAMTSHIINDIKSDLLVTPEENGGWPNLNSRSTPSRGRVPGGDSISPRQLTIGPNFSLTDLLATPMRLGGRPFSETCGDPRPGHN